MLQSIFQEQLRIALEKRMQTAVSELEQEKANELAQLQKSIAGLKQQIDMQSQQYEEALRRAENDKQQALLLGKLATHSSNTSVQLQPLFHHATDFSSSRSKSHDGESREFTRRSRRRTIEL